MSCNAAIEWTSRAGGEYKAIHSETCDTCEFTFGDELCRNSPPCDQQHRSDGVPIAWVSKRNPLDVTVPEYDFPSLSDDDADEDEDDQHVCESLYWKYRDAIEKKDKLEASIKELFRALDSGHQQLIERARDKINEHLK